MKLILCTLASLCLLAQAAIHPPKVADKTFLHRQKDIYELFWHVDQPTVYHPELYQIARAYNIEANIDNYANREAVHEFLDLLQHGMLPRGQIFSSMNPHLSKQALVLFHLLHSAKTFETFYNTAVWARFNVNEQMYLYSLSVAVIHRPDTRHISLPPLYEVMPHFFFNEDVMQKAYNIAMGDTGVRKTMGGIDHHIIFANYSEWKPNEQNWQLHKLNYFFEDIGLNAFCFMAHHAFPTHLMASKFNLPAAGRGEYYFFLHRQLLARYYLERLSNGLGEIEPISVERPISTGFYPQMHYRNGVAFPHRETGAIVPLYLQKEMQKLKDFHSRITFAIDSGYALDKDGNRVNIYTKEGLNILGNMVQGNADSINRQLYGNLDALARKIFGFGFETNARHKFVPSALELFSTSMRDPAFYSIYKNILSYYFRYKENLPMYTHKELQFPGVTITSVDVDKLMTYFDNFESMVSNGLSIRSHEEARNMMINARQQRLNHKPFTYHILVNSDKNTKALVKIFFGPKYDMHGHELQLEDNYMNFVELDQWIHDLKVGSNEIQRSSHQSIYVLPDEVPSAVLYRKMLEGINGTESYTYSPQPYGYPDRLILPKGTKEGMTFKLFVMVAPVDPSAVTNIFDPVWGETIVTGYPLGYPLDRPTHPMHFFVPNMMSKDVTIYHKEMEELNIAA